MRRIIAISACIFLFIFCGYTQHNLGIGIANPNAKLEVRGNGISYDVLKVSIYKVS